MKRAALLACFSFVAFGVLPPIARAAIAIDPNSPSTLYFARSRGYFLRSDDGGTSWAVKSSGLPLQDVQAILALGTPTVLYAATDAGIYRSRDRGENWSTANAGLEGLTVFDVSGSPAQSVIFATTSSGAYKSSDAGASWVAAGALPAPAAIIAPDPTHPFIVYAGVSNSLYRSSDLGTTWVRTGAELPISTSAAIYSIAIDPNDPSTLMIVEASTLDGPRTHISDYELFVSHDRGNTVSRVPTPLDGGVLSAAFDSGSYACVGGHTSVATSADQGRNWSISSGANAFRFASSPGTPRVLAEGSDFTDQVLFLSDDHGYSWIRLPLSPCEGLREQLCLGQGRYRVGLSAFSGGQTLHGIAVPISPDAGAFWLFSENNLEVVVKIVDGRPFNGRFWFFAATLTDLGFTIGVETADHSNNRSFQQYPGEMRSFVDQSLWDPFPH